MILVDLSHLIIEAASGSLNRIQMIDPKLCRHIFLMRLSSVISRFSKIYGEPVICRDGKGYWRRDDFKFYKDGRAKAREESNFDWKTVFDVADMISKELDEVFKFKVLRMEKMEADDIISHIVRNNPEKHVIISRDGDFLQLKALGNVDQWDCIKNTMLDLDEGQTVNECMVDHIIRGDSGDGVPNIFSDDDYLVNKIRQTSIRKPMIEHVSAEFDLSSLEKPDFKAIAESILKSDAFKSAVKKHDMDQAKLEERLKRNFNLVNLTADNEKVDKVVADMLKGMEPRRMDAMEVLDYCSQLGLEEFSGNLNKMMWWIK
jgi:5'-3' exonuclease, N-terminal resolvase-like domain